MAQPSKFFHLSHLRKLKGSEQVAAICYRMRGSKIEFLLVQTRGANWIFPKGSAEPGLTHAQAAALEAYEEAGVHGRIEETSFSRYVRRQPATRNSPAIDLAVGAHLCEVTWMEPAPETGRNPSWFSLTKAKRLLEEGRKADYAHELSRVLDRAVDRIKEQRSRRPRIAAPSKKDALQKVYFIDNAWASPMVKPLALPAKSSSRSKARR